jgi:DNA-binding response OmpR family regulator
MKRKTHILIVDDDPNVCEIVQAYCEREGFRCACSHGGEDAMRQLASFQPDLIVLDVMLVNEDGIGWCREARRVTDAPIVFLSSREEDDVKISALMQGGDDFVTKPFSPGVLMARIKAHLRRVSGGRNDQLLEFSGIALDFMSQTAIVRGTVVHLSRKEFSMLSYMAQNANQPVGVDTLYQLIWGMDSLEDTRTVAVHVSNLRKKIEANPSHPVFIVTVRGIGYMLATGDAPASAPTRNLPS